MACNTNLLQLISSDKMLSKYWAFLSNKKSASSLNADVLLENFFSLSHKPSFLNNFLME